MTRDSRDHLRERGYGGPGRQWEWRLEGRTQSQQGSPSQEGGGPGGEVSGEAENKGVQAMGVIRSSTVSPAAEMEGDKQHVGPGAQFQLFVSHNIRSSRNRRVRGRPILKVRCPPNTLNPFTRLEPESG